LTRRNFVSLAAAAVFTGAPPASKMGIATTSYMTFGKPRDTLAFLEHCHSLGAAGIQSALTSTDPAYLKNLRAKADQYGMYLETMVGLPRKGDVETFQRGVQAAKDAGALCIRTGALSGRRYETFATLPDWQMFVADSIAGIKQAVPVVEKIKIPIGIENHKDWTLDEMVPLLKSHSSEYVGVCLDFGNNISLLDDPMEVVQTLAPYAVSTHLKDMGVDNYTDGFLLSELPLGEGFLDLKAMCAAVRKARPKTRFTLEMITRNALEVPCLTDKYWTTFPDRNGRYLSRTLKLVQKESVRLQALPRVDGLSREAQLRLEEENVKHCLNHAREQLDL
jgi:sugar phosphate isomerase/epimerase